MDLARDGFTIIRGVLSAQQCLDVAKEIRDSFGAGEADAIEGQSRRIVGGRNLICLWDGWRRVLDHADLTRLIHQQIGIDAGLVRILYFDKPPGQGWALSLHRDKTIAVAQHHIPTDPFTKPTVKANVPHVEATEDLLQSMLTLRIHLDPMCDANGPLVVVPGSHSDLASTCDEPSVPIHCDAGDVFVMRPLLLHGSRAPSTDTQLHRRVVHLEMASSEILPGRYLWHQFVSLSEKSGECQA